jgi:tetratricopeptide (TPR) repeat protein
MPSIQELQQRAIEYAKSGDFGAQALATNLELAKIAPANEGALTRLSRCYMEGGQLDEATATLDAALQLNPQNTIARSLQLEVTKRRVASMPVVKTQRPRATAGARPARKSGPAVRLRTSRFGAQVAGVGRAEFAALGQLAPDAAVESLGARIEPLLMALNERPFAAKAVETRNRAGQSGARLFRRHTVHSGGPGHLRVFHQGARWEPQLTIGLFSSTPWGRDAVCAGIGFKLTPKGSESDHERALAHFAQFQQLVSGAWRGFLTQWMSMSAGFIQHGDTPPSTDLLPNDALAWLINCQHPATVGWVFFGRWLFFDRSQDAETLADGRRLVAWIDSSFTDLLPIWTSLYRA